MHNNALIRHIRRIMAHTIHFRYAFHSAILSDFSAYIPFCDFLEIFKIFLKKPREFFVNGRTFSREFARTDRLLRFDFS